MADLKPLYKRAEEALNKRNYDYARDIYLQIISMAPDENEARKLLRATLKRKYQEQGAPSRITQKINLARTSTTLAVQRNPQSRMETAQKYLIEDPENSNMRVQLATALFDLGHKNGAMAEAEMAIEVNPNNAEALKIMGKVYTTFRKIPEAQSALARARNLKPEDRELDKLIKDLMAEATMAKGFSDEKHDYRSSMKNVDQAVELEKAGHLVKTDEDVVGHIAKMIQLHEQNPNDVKLIAKIGEAHAEMKKDFKVAQEWYKKASALSPQDSQLKDRVEDMDVKMYDAAIAKAATDEQKKQLAAQKLAYEVKSYERRMADRPTDMLVRYQLALRYYRAGQIEKAISEFQNSVKDPKCKLESHIYMGLAFQKKKVYDLAENNYKAAEQSALTDDRKMEIWYYWGKCAEESGKAPLAIELYTKIAERDFNFKNGDVAARLERLKGGQ